MAEATGISWTDSTFNPFIGCTKVSEGCTNCYAEALMDKRWNKVRWGPGSPRVRTKTWGDPVRWNAQPFAECMGCGWRGEAREAGKPKVFAGFNQPTPMLGCPACHAPLLKEARRRVFCASLADVFDNEAPDEWRADLFHLIEATPHLDWLLLTKRVGNVREMVPMHWHNPGAWPRHARLGATMVNQPEYDRDIGKLLALPAPVHFVSIEPMLGPIDMRMGGASMPDYSPHRPLPRVDWVIAGGESGQHARPAHPDWFRSLAQQCRAAGVAFHFKQWGEWRPADPITGVSMGDEMRRGTVQLLHAPGNPEGFFRSGDAFVRKVGKKAAGRLLDGVEHNGFPTP